MNSLRDAFRKALSACRTTYTLFSARGQASNLDDEEEVKGESDLSLKEVFYTFTYLTKKLNLKQELITDMALTDSDAKLIIDSKRFRITVECIRSNYSRIQRKLKDIVGNILCRAL